MTAPIAMYLNFLPLKLLTEATIPYIEKIIQRGKYRVMIPIETQNNVPGASFGLEVSAGSETNISTRPTIKVIIVRARNIS